MTITLRPIAADNWRAVYKLTRTMSDEQQGFVMDNGLSLLEAFYEPEVFSARAVYDNETPVGFLMTGYDAENQRHWLVRLMIGGEFQGKGYGRAAMQIVIDQFNAMSNCDAVFVAVVPENTAGRHLYSSLGFLDTGRIVDENCIYRLPLHQMSMSQQP